MLGEGITSIAEDELIASEFPVDVGVITEGAAGDEGRVMDSVGVLGTIEVSGVMKAPGGMLDVAAADPDVIIMDSYESENCSKTGDDIVAWIKSVAVLLELDSAFSK